MSKVNPKVNSDILLNEYLSAIIEKTSFIFGGVFEIERQLENVKMVCINEIFRGYDERIKSISKQLTTEGLETSKLGEVLVNILSNTYGRICTVVDATVETKRAKFVKDLVHKVIWAKANEFVKDIEQLVRNGINENNCKKY